MVNLSTYGRRFSFYRDFSRDAVHGLVGLYMDALDLLILCAIKVELK